MTTLFRRIAPLGILFSALFSSSAFADFTSSASSASSTSIGSSSVSLEKSSNSSSKGKDAVAQGQYTVVDIAPLTDKPDMLRLSLTAVNGEPGNANDFVLLLPREAAERAQLAAGQVIAAEHREYGLAFAALDTSGKTTPFFLVLDDAWYRELQSRPVVL